MNRQNLIRPNLLGDLRAEADSSMLNKAFIETADYRTLIETSDRIVVVGRRGTGKSALTIRLEHHWRTSDDVEVVKIAPEEYQVIGIRPLVRLFGDSFNKARAGARLAWRYALMMEAARSLSPHYKFTKSESYPILQQHLRHWPKERASITEALRYRLLDVVDESQSPEERIGNLPVALDLRKIEDALRTACEDVKTSTVFLVDKLDEGYEPDDIGVGFIDGLVQAAIDIKTRIPNIKPIIFLRDNIFRAVQTFDPDYTRNIEGHVLRLHWDENALFNFASLRLKFAFELEDESSLKIWNKCTAGDLKGKRGFSRCLQLTLYRPRDLVALLNEAFHFALKAGQTHIMETQVEQTAHAISQNRLDDLKKEYSSVLPGLSEYVGAFHGQHPQLAVESAVDRLQHVLSEGSSDPLIQQDFLILSDANAVIRGLYSVGFLGIREPTAGSFVFCHDGRSPDRGFNIGDQVLVHPCYWIALNCAKEGVDPSVADEIYDEYDIAVSSETPAIRKTRIGQLIAELGQIPEGTNGATAFEEWCRKAIRICFAKGLRNVELRPNKLAKSRRDIVATNLGEDEAWKRIYEDYGTRQVTFEVKNYQGLDASDYQQIQSYLTGEYGRFALVITRDDSTDLYAQRDVEWVREMYSNHQVLIVKLTGKFFCKLLHKLRDPQKHDAVNDSLHRLLDTYTRLYLAGQTMSDVQKRKGKRKRRRLKRAKKGTPTS
ncbi:MAG TPA: ATP-binding protein [Gammaproteobacteria bacterium]|nr:ATP-binding protein [Gammaproteobacteria bacterium]